MRADFEVTEEERRKLEALVRETLELDESETRELLAAAEREVECSVELFQFTRLIDEAFTREQKAKVVERLWRIAYADENVDRLEEHLVRKIANLLHVSHRDYIAAKLAAEERLTRVAARSPMPRDRTRLSRRIALHPAGPHCRGTGNAQPESEKKSRRR